MALKLLEKDNFLNNLESTRSMNLYRLKRFWMGKYIVHVFKRSQTP